MIICPATGKDCQRDCDSGVTPAPGSVILCKIKELATVDMQRLLAPPLNQLVTRYATNLMGPDPSWQ